MNFKKTLVLAFFLCAALVYLTKFELPKQEREKNKGLIYKESQAGVIEKIELTKAATDGVEAQTFTLVNTSKEAPATAEKIGLTDTVDLKPSTWRLQGIDDLPLESIATSAMISSLQELKLDTALSAEESKGGLKDFGLENPELKVKIKEFSGKESEISFGALNHYLAQRYVKASFGDSIYLVPEATFTALNRQALDFRDKSPIKFNDQEIASIDLKSSKGETKLSQTTPGVWDIEAPEKYKANINIIAELLTTLKGLKVAEFNDQASTKLADFKLDKPVTTLKLNFTAESKREPLTILFSSIKNTIPDSEQVSDQIYFTYLGASAVFKAISDPLPQLDRSSNELKDPTILSLDVERIEKINFTNAEGKTLAVERVAKDWTVNGKPGDAMFIGQVLASVVSLQASGFSQPDNATFAKPTLQIAISLKAEKPDASPETKLLMVGGIAGDKPSKSYFVRTGDKPTVFLISEDDFKKINAREETLIQIN